MTQEATHREDLRFFGAVGASISHEMKNVLAIVKEMTGLLEDLALMAQKGKALDLARLQSIAGRIQFQVERGDRIMKNLNRFSHSVDRDEETVELSDAARFVSQLAERKAAMRSVTLSMAPDSKPVSATLDLFSLEHRIWRALVAAIEGAAQGDRLTLTVEKSENGPSLRLSAVSASADKNAADMSVTLAPGDPRSAS